MIGSDSYGPRIEHKQFKRSVRLCTGDQLSGTMGTAILKEAEERSWAAFQVLYNL